MNTFVKMGCVAVLGMGFAGTAANAQTEGTARLETTLVNLSGNGNDHWTVVWVTKADGTFIKTLHKQGNSYGWTSSQWTKHTPQWNAARAGSTVVDGYSGATATTYSGTDNPVIVTWNCRDLSNNLVPDGNYKFWVQYAEDSSSPGPYTTAGLLWTKGPANGGTTTYANQAGNFTNMKVVWSPVLPPNATITTVNVQGSAIIITGTGTVSTAYTVVGSTNLNQAVETWPTVGLGTISGTGSFSNSIPLNSAFPNGYYQLTLP